MTTATTLAVALLLCLRAAPPADAQGAGANVGGVITDDTGAALPGVTVTIVNKANGSQQTMVTGPEGNYRAVALQPATYVMSAELSGFASVKREVTLVVGADATVDFKLGVAALAESLTVIGEAPLVEVTKSQPSSVIVGDQVSALPVLDRNFLVLAQLLPGAGPLTNVSLRFATTKFGGIADQRNGYTTLIDGGSVDDHIWGSPTINMTQDAVQEFKVYRNQFDAQYGSALLAVVNVVTKSGTNQYNGSGFYFGRDQKLNARNAFAKSKPDFNQQRYGGSLGGPITLNRTHFFGAYEFLNINRSAIVALPAVNPFAAQQNGIYPFNATEHVGDAKLDHRFTDDNTIFVRWAYDNSHTPSGGPPNATGTIFDYSRSHSLVAEDNWILSQNMVNSLRFHLLRHNVGTVPANYDLQISRPSYSFGQNGVAPQFFPRRNYSFFDTLYINTPRHDLKAGAEITLASNDFEAHFNEHGAFTFLTDAPFDPNNPATWPFTFVQQKPGFYRYNSKQIAAYVQDNWRMHPNVRVNLGLRYDIDTNLRSNDFYSTLFDNPLFKGIENFISQDRGNDLNNLQPRVGAAWDVRGNGTLVARGGFGMYVTRNRPWFNLTSMDKVMGSAVRIEDPQQLKFFPDINAVLGGKTLDQYIAAGGVRSLYLISNDYVLPYALNSTVGFGWQLNAVTSVDVDYVHDYATHQLGSTDRNLPATGRVNATNPRRVAQFSQVGVMENFSTTWYDALETQLRTRVRGTDSLQVSYTLSRSLLDGVDFYSTYRGTQRTPQEKGYNATDSRHNLTVSGSTALAWGFHLSGIFKAISGGPRNVSSGVDLDGDLSITGDRPVGLPPKIGRGNVDEHLRIINEFRTSRGLAPITKDLLRLNPIVTLDLRLTKNVQLGGPQRLEIFLESYNTTNYVSYSGISSGNMNTASFFIRSAARDARQIQLGARYVF
ncbi:MAG: TonB-dependent receptor [Acidobacteria bacterium]|nr:TonB-dependent receptor [Acidobacteriota bacterium]